MAKNKHKEKATIKEASQVNAEILAHEIRPGTTVKISHKIVEGDKERIQVFQGMVLQIRGDKDHKMITVRKMSRGIGVERIFPLNSPVLSKIEVKKHAKVRRAKLYYLRGKKGQDAKLKEEKVEE
jgi:large subunit ribosomal protein L19